MLQHLQQWVNEAGITKKITFHCARHTYACLLIDNNIPLPTVQEMMGHSSIRNTMKYVKVMDKQRVNAANVIPSIF